MGDGAEEMPPDWEDDDRTEEIKSATLEEKYLKRQIRHKRKELDEASRGNVFMARDLDAVKKKQKKEKDRLESLCQQTLRTHMISQRILHTADSALAERTDRSLFLTNWVSQTKYDRNTLSMMPIPVRDHTIQKLQIKFENFYHYPLEFDKVSHTYPGTDRLSPLTLIVMKSTEIKQKVKDFIESPGLWTCDSRRRYLSQRLRVQRVVDRLEHRKRMPLEAVIQCIKLSIYRKNGRSYAQAEEAFRLRYEIDRDQNILRRRSNRAVQVFIRMDKVVYPVTTECYIHPDIKDIIKEYWYDSLYWVTGPKSDMVFTCSDSKDGVLAKPSDTYCMVKAQEMPDKFPTTGVAPGRLFVLEDGYTMGTWDQELHAFYVHPTMDGIFLFMLLNAAIKKYRGYSMPDGIILTEATRKKYQ